MAIQRGEIYFVNLNPTIGREQAGVRPVLVLSSDKLNRLPLVVTVVIGTKAANVKRAYASTVCVPPEESGLPQETVFLCFQLRSLDPSRFPNQRAGKLSDAYMDQVENSVCWCLEL
ncbi:MAG: type II toxin-antitoxin system PemK/MazF family toxin [Planctomycetes bacterium]|nr:type II toxin-antitoxin system PemK/MazF family toxin [Planctomycetota bacterium]